MKFLTFQPLVYTGSDDRFLMTNLGALVSALNALGHEAYQTALAPEPGRVGEVFNGVLLCSSEQVADPAWWKDRNPWAVITNTWGAPRFADIRRAIRAATPRHLDRLDTDGIRSPRVDLPLYLYQYFSRLSDSRYQWKRLMAPVMPFGIAAIHRLFPGILERQQAATIDKIPLVSAESPISVERMKRLQRVHGFSGSNLRLSPFPVSMDSLIPIGKIVDKSNTIISVGRWGAHQKNFPMLLEVLESFLTADPDWDAEVLGSLPDGTARMLQHYAPQSGSRIHCRGTMPNKEIGAVMARARIFLMTSRHESFGIAAAEALCAGCSVVGPPHIPSVPWFCGSDSGTVATRYSRIGLLDAIEAEASAWETEARDPARIAEIWRERVGGKAVAKSLLAQLDALS